MKVQELMSRPAITCRQGDSLDSAAGLMWEHDYGALPVVDNDNTIVGMITDRDICLAAYTEDEPLNEILVADVADGEVFSIRPADSVQEAERVMREHQVRRLPVVDERDRVVGVLSLNDIAIEGQREASQKSLKRKQIKSDDVLETLAAICTPPRKKRTQLTQH